MPKPENTSAWRDLLVGMVHPEIDEKPMQYAQWKQDQRMRRGGLQECPQCGNTVNRSINGDKCPFCHEATFEGVENGG